MQYNITNLIITNTIHSVLCLYETTLSANNWRTVQLAYLKFIIIIITTNKKES